MHVGHEGPSWTSGLCYDGTAYKASHSVVPPVRSAQGTAQADSRSGKPKSPAQGTLRDSVWER